MNEAEWYETYLPNGISGPVLGLGHLGLDAIPESLFDKIPRDVTVIDLSFNNLTSISASINKCSQILELWLNNNKLTNIPDVSNLFLTRLDVSHNELTDISNINTVILDASYNKITSVSGLSNNVCILNLQFNQLTDLPVDVCQLPNLQVLNICSNPITDINSISSHFTHHLNEFWHD